MPVTGAKDQGGMLNIQCVKFTGIYRQNMAEIELIIPKFMFSLVHNHLFSLPQNKPFISTEGAATVAQNGQTHKTLALVTTFREYHGHCSFLSMLGTMGG